MNDKWTITHCSIVRSLEELPDTTLDELKKAIEGEEERRDIIRYNRAQERGKQIVTLIEQAENEVFWVTNRGDKLDPSNIWVQR